MTPPLYDSHSARMMDFSILASHQYHVAKTRQLDASISHKGWPWPGSWLYPRKSLAGRMEPLTSQKNSYRPATRFLKNSHMFINWRIPFCIRVDDNWDKRKQKDNKDLARLPILNQDSSVALCGMGRNIHSKIGWLLETLFVYTIPSTEPKGSLLWLPSQPTQGQTEVVNSGSA